MESLRHPHSGDQVPVRTDIADDDVEFRQISNHPGCFAGSDGHIYSTRILVRRPGYRTGWTTKYDGPRRVLRGIPNGRGYLRVALSEPGLRKTRWASVHRLVCEAFHGPCPPGMECRHLDGVGTHNRPSNLKWGTKTENGADTRRHGTLVGELNGNAKLRWADIHEILRMRREGISVQVIGERFGVSINTVYPILNGRSWQSKEGRNDG